MSPGTVSVLSVSVLLIAWYVAGHLYNRRRGHRLRGWIEAGLLALEGEQEAGWIGSPASGARIIVRRAKHLFRRLEITILLENREIPLLWLVDCLRGRRDRIIMRGTLRSPRRGDVEVTSARPSNKHRETWTWQQGPNGLHIGFWDARGQRRASQLAPWLGKYGPHLYYFYWRSQDPHISLQLRVAGLLNQEAEAFLTDLSTALRAS